MSESEVSRNFAAVLERIKSGVEVVVEQDNRAVAVIRPPTRLGRPITECIAIAEARGLTVTLDEGFSKDVEEFIQSHQSPWNPPSWD